MKLLGLITLFISQSVWASGGFNFFAEGSHALHIPSHTLALLFSTTLFLVIGILYRSKFHKTTFRSIVFCIAERP
jgi:hypothetical protein